MMLTMTTTRVLQDAPIRSILDVTDKSVSSGDKVLK